MLKIIHLYYSTLMDFDHWHHCGDSPLLSGNVADSHWNKTAFGDREVAKNLD